MSVNRPAQFSPGYPLPDPGFLCPATANSAVYAANLGDHKLRTRSTVLGIHADYAEQDSCKLLLANGLRKFSAGAASPGTTGHFSAQPVLCCVFRGSCL